MTIIPQASCNERSSNFDIGKSEEVLSVKCNCGGEITNPVNFSDRNFYKSPAIYTIPQAFTCSECGYIVEELDIL